jgi:hypothetical protein
MEKQKLPNAIAVLILGILSIPGCCFYGVGLIFGIVALVLAKKDTVLYNSDPSLYDGYNNVKTGKILAIIGIILSAIYIIMLISLIATFGFAALQDQELMQERMREMMGQ